LAVTTMGLVAILTGVMGAFWGTVATGAIAGFASGVNLLHRSCMGV